MKGRKRHVLVDTLGLVLGVLVLPADLSDSRGARELIKAVFQQFPRMKKLFVDGGYKQGCCQWLAELTGWSVEIVKRPKVNKPPRRARWARAEPPAQPPPPAPRRFQVLPWRWIVERTFGWLGRHRRHSKDYEALPVSSETWLWVAALRVLLPRFLDGQGV